MARYSEKERKVMVGKSVRDRVMVRESGRYRKRA